MKRPLDGVEYPPPPLAPPPLARTRPGTHLLVLDKNKKNYISFLVR